MAYSAERKVIRCISGLSKSEKKKFRDSERMRMANLKEIGTANVGPFLYFSQNVRHILDKYIKVHQTEKL